MGAEQFNHEAMRVPYCPDAEVFYWLFISDVIRNIHKGKALKPADSVHLVANRGGEASLVVWKPIKYNEPTGICIAGPGVGWYVSQWHSRPGHETVVLGRAVAIDGGNVSQSKIIKSVDHLPINEAMKSELYSIASSVPFKYPALLAKALQVAGYPVDYDAFISNSIRENIYWDNSNNPNWID